MSVADPIILSASVALTPLRVRHVPFSVGANGKENIAKAANGRALRVLAGALTTTGNATIAVCSGADVVVRWHVSGALVLPFSQIGWADIGDDLTIHAIGDPIAGTLVVADVSRGLTNLAKPCAAPETPTRDDSAPLQRGDAVSHGPPGAGGKTRLVSQSGSSAPSHTRGAEPAEEPGEPAPVATAGERPKAGASRKGAVAR